MISSIHETNASSEPRLNSRDGSISGQRVKNCHICGFEFSKNALANHQRSIGMPRRAIATLSAGNKAFYSCSKCLENFPQHQFKAHVRNCSSTDYSTDLYKMDDGHIQKIIPSSAPARRRPSNRFSENNNTPEQRYSSREGYEEAIVALAAEANTAFPKKTSFKSELSIVEPELNKSDQLKSPLKTKSSPSANNIQEQIDQDFSGPEPVPYPSFHENSEIEQMDVSKYLIPCEICNRKFMEDRLEKHRTICSKTKDKSRKVFDMRKTRVQGTEMEKYNKKDPATETKPVEKKASNWRVKHEVFQNMLSGTKKANGASPIKNIEPNPDYIKCPSCERRFNEESGKRHIPHCQEQKNKKAMESKNQRVTNGKDKNEELKRRIGYKPPSPRKLKQK